MKQLIVKEFGNVVYLQTLESGQTITQGLDNYSTFSNYFKELIILISQHVETVNLVLDVTERYTSLFLYLENSDKCNSITDSLIAKYGDEIENVVIRTAEYGVEMEIQNDFYELNE